jgi:hypothetical protein
MALPLYSVERIGRLVFAGQGIDHGLSVWVILEYTKRSMSWKDLNQQGNEYAQSKLKFKERLMPPRFRSA